MNEDKIKESFKRIREDMSYFFEQIQEINRTLEELKQEIKNTTQKSQIPTIPTQTPTHHHSDKASTSQIKGFSSGNEGVPTHHPTFQPTIQHPMISTPDTKNSLKNAQFHTKTDKIEHLQRASEILNSLDELKKEVRFKFKKLTNQEMLVFSIIYQLDELGIAPDYEILAEKANLSTISIRDYVGKIIKKGIPLEKYKEDNKKVVLKIPENLKKIASLNTILELREL